MKLKDDFFKVVDFSENPDEAAYCIELNPSHPIYRAHFPENPITPGVCILQIIKELTSEYLRRDLFLQKAEKIRFLNVINPLENGQVNISLNINPEGGLYKVSGTVFTTESTFSKLSLIFGQ